MPRSFVLYINYDRTHPENIFVFLSEFATLSRVYCTWKMRGGKFVENFTDTYFSVNTAILTIPDYIYKVITVGLKNKKNIGKNFHV